MGGGTGYHLIIGLIKYKPDIFSACIITIEKDISSKRREQGHRETEQIIPLFKAL